MKKYIFITVLLIKTNKIDVVYYFAFQGTINYHVLFLSFILLFANLLNMSQF